MYILYIHILHVSAAWETVRLLFFLATKIEHEACLGSLCAGMGSGVSECVDVPCTCILKMMLAYVVQLDTRKFWQLQRRKKEVLRSCCHISYRLAVVRCIMATQMNSMHTGKIQTCCGYLGNCDFVKPLRILWFLLPIEHSKNFHTKCRRKNIEISIIQFKQSVKTHLENPSPMNRRCIIVQMRLIRTYWHYTDTNDTSMASWTHHNSPNRLIWPGLMTNELALMMIGLRPPALHVCASLYISVTSWHCAFFVNFPASCWAPWPAGHGPVHRLPSRDSGPMSHVALGGAPLRC